MEIIPAIDIKQKKLVRLIGGRFDSCTYYSMTPIEAACLWEKQGASWLHLVDLDGAAEGKLVNIDIVEHILKNVSIPIQLGGGIRTEDDLRKVFSLGVSRVIISTSFLEDVDFQKDLVRKYNNNLAISLDVKENKIMVRGWVKQLSLDLETALTKFGKLNIKLLIYTDISKDGTLSGIDIEKLKKFLGLSPIPVIASGGISTLKQIEDLRKINRNLYWIIIGKALYEKKFKFREAISVANK